MGKGIIKNRATIGDGYTENKPLQRHAYKNYSDLPVNDHTEWNSSNNNIGILDHYQYQADGEGVDIVIEDIGGFGNDFIVDLLGKEGAYRFQNINWSEESGGTLKEIEYDKLISGLQNQTNSLHAVNVASSAAGYLGGAAKGARVYNYNTTDGWFTTIYDTSDEYFNEKDQSTRYKTPQAYATSPLSAVDTGKDLVAWHNAKMAEGGSGRPTIFIKSVGNALRLESLPSGGMYRGTPWTYNGETRQELWDNYGIVTQDNSNYPEGYSVNVGYNADKYNADGSIRKEVIEEWNSTTQSYDYSLDPVQDYIDAGIHVFLAGGNQNEWIDVNPNDTDSALLDFYPNNTAGLDWDNYIEYNLPDGTTSRYYYTRGKDSHLVNAVVCGQVYATDSNVDGQNPNGDYREVNGGYRAHGYGVGLYSWEYSGAVALEDDIYAGDTPEGAANAADYAKYGTSVMRPVDDKDPNRREHPVDPNFSYGKFNGTSSCAPFIAGIAACYLEKEPNLTPKELYLKLLQNSGEAEGHYDTPTVNLPARADMSGWRVNTIYNPYAKQKRLEIKGNLFFTSGTQLYTQNSTIGSDIDNIVTSSNPTNSSTITLQLKDNNGAFVDTAGLVVDFVASVGSLSNVVDNNDGTYTATYTSPSSGSGVVEIIAKILGKTCAEQLQINYTDHILPDIVTSGVSFAINDSLAQNNIHIHSFTTDQTTATLSLSGVDADDFTLTQNGTNGLLSLNFKPDAYTKDQYNVTVESTNLAGTDTEDFVLNINDMTPPQINIEILHDGFTNWTDAANIKYLTYTENTIPANTDLFRVTATDYDPDLTLYVALGGTSKFEWIPDANDPNTGVIRAKELNDYEQWGQFQVMDFYAVVNSSGDLVDDYHDYEGTHRLSYTVVRVYTENVDDTPPTFSSSNVASSVERNTPAASTIYVAAAADVYDEGTTDITYSIIDNQHEGRYTIDAATGTVRTTSVVDESWGNSASFTVLASDLHGNTSSLLVTYSIIAPVPATITSGIFVASIEENLSLNDHLAYDANANKPVTWSLINPNTGDYGTTLVSNNQPNLTVEIDANSGIVKLFGTTDYEVANTLEYTVRATTSTGAITLKTVSHPITDLYEGNVHPEINGWNNLLGGTVWEAPIPENTAIDTIVGIVVPKTVGGDVIPNCYFTLTGDNSSYLEINNNTGYITLKQNLDYETATLIEDLLITIETPAGVTKELITKIAVQNIDEVAPYFFGSNSWEVPAYAQGQVVGTVQASDQHYNDEAAVSDITYEIVYEGYSGNPAPATYSINSTNGQVTALVDEPFTTDAQNQGAALRVRITDEAGNAAEQTYYLAVEEADPSNVVQDWKFLPTVKTAGYGSGHNDQVGMWNVVEHVYDNGYAISNGRLYIRATVTATGSSYWQNDFAVAMAQVLDMDGNIVQEILPYSYTAQTNTGLKYNNDVSVGDLDSEAWSYMGELAQGTAGTTRQWNLGHSTASSSTGAAGGVYSYAYNTPLTVGNSTYYMDTNSPYFYKEATSSATNSANIMRLGWSTNTLPAQGKIRIAYFNSGSTTINENATLAVAFK